MPRGVTPQIGPDATGVGWLYRPIIAGVMSRIAAPMVGGMISSAVLTLALIPAIYALVKQ